MHKLAGGESSCAANDYENKRCAHDAHTVLVDQKTGRINLIGNFILEEIRTSPSWELSEGVDSSNGHFDTSLGSSIGVVRPGRRNFRPPVVACIAFLVDSETCLSGAVKARELLIVDRQRKSANLKNELYELISIESMHRQIESVSLEETCISQRLHSNIEHLSDNSQGICTTLSSREHLTCISKQISHLGMDAQLAGCLSVTLRNSPTLLPGFLSYNRHHSRLFVTNKDVCSEGFQLSSRSCRHIIVHLTYPQKVWLDYLWFLRLEALLMKCVMLDDLMNWLSTLGGAYSSLGDHFVHHAENAAKISMQQLHIAIEMGSPPLIIRCCLFYSLSLMQRGQLQRSKRIIRKQYEATKALPIIDERLLMMCQGIWNRLRYLWQKNWKSIQLRKASSATARSE